MSCFKIPYNFKFKLGYFKQKMGVIYLLLAVSIFVAVIFFIAFIISVKKGQYDDTYTPSVRMLFDDELIKDNKTNETD